MQTKLNDYLGGLACTVDGVQQQVLHAIETGLSREDGCLAMLPTFVGGGETPENSERVLVVDAGGSNFRAATVRFEKGAPVVEDFRRHPMPGTDRPMEKEAFFDAIAALIAPLAQQASRVGICFSYAFSSLPGGEGEIISMSKGMRIAGIRGALLGKELEAALVRLGVGGARRYTIVNDSVAALLGAAVQTDLRACDGLAGLIVGTGMNACYFEKTDNIKKISGCSVPEMVINMEAGGFDGFGRTPADKALDDRSSNRGEHFCEKATAGAYLGPLVLELMQRAAEAGFYSPEAAARIAAETTLTTPDLSVYDAEGAGPLARLVGQEEGDRAVTDGILAAVFRRAGTLLVGILAAIAKQTGRGSDPQRPMCVSADGSTFYKCGPLRRSVDAALDEAKKTLGLHFTFVKPENANLVGTAAAALWNE